MTTSWMELRHPLADKLTADCKFRTRHVEFEGVVVLRRVHLTPLTLQEGFHCGAVGHVDWSSSGIGGEGRVGAAGQQEAHHLHVVVLDGVVQGSETDGSTENIKRCFFTCYILLQRWTQPQHLVPS